MDELVNVLLTIDRTYTGTQWVKPGLWAQQSHSLWLEYMWHIMTFLSDVYLGISMMCYRYRCIL